MVDGWMGGQTDDLKELSDGMFFSLKHNTCTRNALLPFHHRSFQCPHPASLAFRQESRARRKRRVTASVTPHTPHHTTDRPAGRRNRIR
mmetsp:Transcript_45659/g.113439  ORF Transcript_45659/g.113439 Transcript_45659/m.113439 type:complete len:89 (-) Transcript_45659:952-1218(-)